MNRKRSQVGESAGPRSSASSDMATSGLPLCYLGRLLMRAHAPRPAPISPPLSDREEAIEDEYAALGKGTRFYKPVSSS